MANLASEIRRLTAGIILNIIYGHRILSYEDKCFEVAENFVVAMKGIARPSLLDISPRCKPLLTALRRN